ncbi:sigma-K factor [Mycobacterium phage Anthony]|uniref:RNA polymerase sigma factor n=1 Tax=Mycobacterium phage Anthony TaxID=2599857 RepID=A0A5J6TI11_9CAUD|nr:sigma-K factor [Mycobacterium phage Anthony]QFG10420.1 RNA polymerase sigma factor [Mycobacterium phage Anthony]
MTLYSDLGPTVKRAAKAVAFQWPGIIEQDDAEQEIHLRLLETPGSIAKLLEMDARAQYRAVVGIGHQIASKARTDYDYFKGSYRYSVKEVKSLLQKGILTEVLSSFKAEKLDILDALEGIADQHAASVRSRYVDEKVPPQGAPAKLLTDSLGALVAEMNKVQKRRYAERDDGPGTRKQASTDDHYESGDFDFEAFAKKQNVGWG